MLKTQQVLNLGVFPVSKHRKQFEMPGAITPINTKGCIGCPVKETGGSPAKNEIN